MSLVVLYILYSQSVLTGNNCNIKNQYIRQSFCLVYYRQSSQEAAQSVKQQLQTVKDKHKADLDALNKQISVMRKDSQRNNTRVTILYFYCFLRLKCFELLQPFYVCFLRQYSKCPIFGFVFYFSGYVLHYEITQGYLSLTLTFFRLLNVLNFYNHFVCFLRQSFKCPISDFVVYFSAFLLYDLMVLLKFLLAWNILSILILAYLAGFDISYG